MSHATERLTAALDGRYRILRELGAGGMATVYLAEDLKHDRKVAVKVLKPELAAVLGAERFVVEIKTTAALSHPHILPLFDSGSADGFLYYVMPYVEGETLRDKLNRETQLGVDEAVRITREVADALEYAHSRGVIHRDIKPENILLQGGRPMVADFGIALAVSAAAGGRMTETGLSLGTPHYMSPEQATAEKEISGRSDVYSLASVCYEMLTGQPPHLGGSAQQIIMKIITEQAPPVTAYRKTVPPHVAAALAKALEKLPADRFETAQAFSEALANPQFTSATSSASAAVAPGATRRASVGVAAAVGLVGLLLGGATMQALGGRAPAREARHLSIVLPDSAPLSFSTVGGINTGARALTVTPDGRELVYVAVEGARTRLYRRALDGFAAEPIAGSESGTFPLVSADGEWVAFFTDSDVRRVPLRGGAPAVLAAVSEVVGADWAPDGRLLVAAREGLALGWIPANGGPFTPLPNPSGLPRTFPHLLPGGRHALVEVPSSTFQTVLAAVELETGRTLALTTNGPTPVDSVAPGSTVAGRHPRYVAPGILLFTGPAGLRALEFDATSLEISGPQREVLGGIRSGADGTQYTVTSDGTIIYAPGEDVGVGSLVWVTRDGRVDSLGFAPQRYGVFSLSPDGRRVVATVYAPSGEPELWVYDLERGTDAKVRTRGFTFSPMWWPDSRRLVFFEFPAGMSAGATIRQLVESTGEHDTLALGWFTSDIAVDTSMLVGSRSLYGIWTRSLGDDEAVVPVDSLDSAWGGAFSPDRRWLAYTSSESGQYEIYVTDLSRRTGRRKLSLDGGEEPVWSPRNDELFYRWGQDWYAVSVPRAGAVDFGRPRQLFRGPYLNVAGRSHDISRDGQRHLLIRGPSTQSVGHLHVITDWTATLTPRR